MCRRRRRGRRLESAESAAAIGFIERGSDQRRLWFQYAFREKEKELGEDLRKLIFEIKDIPRKGLAIAKYSAKEVEGLLQIAREVLTEGCQIHFPSESTGYVQGSYMDVRHWAHSLPSREKMDPPPHSYLSGCPNIGDLTLTKLSEFL